MRRTPLAVAVFAAASLLAGSGPDEPQPSATGVVDAYLDGLGSGRIERVIDDCFDAREFARRVVGADLDALDAGRLTYVEQLASLGLKAALSSGPTDPANPRKVTHTPYRVSGSADETTVTFVFSIPAARSSPPAPAAPPEQFRSTVVLHKRDGVWRIVEIRKVTDLWKSTYAKAHAAGDGPVEFMEHVAAETLRVKNDRNVAARTSRTTLKPAMVANLARIRNAVELYQAEHGGLPDIEHKGLRALVEAGLLKTPPVNPVNRSCAICPPDRRRADAGWTWNPATGEVGACYFDETLGQVNPDRP